MYCSFDHCISLYPTIKAKSKWDTHNKNTMNDHCMITPTIDMHFSEIIKFLQCGWNGFPKCIICYCVSISRCMPGSRGNEEIGKVLCHIIQEHLI